MNNASHYTYFEISLSYIEVHFSTECSIFHQCAFVGVLGKCKYFLIQGYGIYNVLGCSFPLKTLAKWLLMEMEKRQSVTPCCEMCAGWGVAVNELQPTSRCDVVTLRQAQSIRSNN